jgi:hypothetical protein
VSASEVALTWTDAASNETGYRVERSANGGATFAPVGLELAPDSEAYTDTTCAAPSAYTYRVVALGPGGDAASGAVPIRFDVALAPTIGLATATSSTTVSVAWTQNAPDAVSATVYRSTDDVTFTPVATPAPTDGSWEDSGLTPETTYHYRVTATNLIGESVQSASATATTAPAPLIPPDAAPTGFAAGTATYNSVPLTWSCAATNETGFKIWRSTSNTFPGGAATYLPAANATSFTATGLSASTTYYFWIAATNPQGDNPTTPSTSVTATTLQPPPVAPSGLTAVAYMPPRSLTYTGIKFAWVDNATTETGFKLEGAAYDALQKAPCGYLGIRWTSVATVSANTVTFLQSFVRLPASGSKSCFRVLAYNGSGNSAASVAVFTMP